MQAEVNGQIIELSEDGWLLKLYQWSEELAEKNDDNENIAELNDQHWDIINEARDYFVENGKVA